MKLYKRRDDVICHLGVFEKAYLEHRGHGQMIGVSVYRGPCHIGWVQADSGKFILRLGASVTDGEIVSFSREQTTWQRFVGWLASF